MIIQITIFVIKIFEENMNIDFVKETEKIKYLSDI